MIEKYKSQAARNTFARGPRDWFKSFISGCKNINLNSSLTVNSISWCCFPRSVTSYCLAWVLATRRYANCHDIVSCFTRVRLLIVFYCC